MYTTSYQQVGIVSASATLLHLTITLRDDLFIRALLVDWTASGPFFGPIAAASRSHDPIAGPPEYRRLYYVDTATPVRVDGASAEKHIGSC
jgi:hypothetical protein